MNKTVTDLQSELRGKVKNNKEKQIVMRAAGRHFINGIIEHVRMLKINSAMERENRQRIGGVEYCLELFIGSFNGIINKEDIEQALIAKPKAPRTRNRAQKPL